MGLLTRVSNLGISILTSQRYHPACASFTSETLHVLLKHWLLFSLSVWLQICSDFICVLLNPDALRCQETRHLPNVFVFKEQWKIREEPDGTFSVLGVSFRKMWRSLGIAATAAPATGDIQEKQELTFWNAHFSVHPLRKHKEPYLTGCVARMRLNLESNFCFGLLDRKSYLRQTPKSQLFATFPFCHVKDGPSLILSRLTAHHRAAMRPAWGGGWW